MPTIITGYVPGGVKAVVKIFIVGVGVQVLAPELVGVQETGEKDAELFGGNPETLKVTGVGVPAVRVVVIVFETELPWTTLLSPGFESEKSNAPCGGGGVEHEKFDDGVPELGLYAHPPEQ